MGFRLALVCCTLLPGCGESTELVDDAEARLIRDAEALRQLMLAGDMGAVMGQIPGDLIPGGQAAKDSALAAAEAAKNSVIELAQDMVWDAPGAIHQVGDRYVSVVPYSSSLNGSPMRACQIAVSSDGGRTWGFLSGSSGALAGLRVMAPVLLATIEDDIRAVEVAGRSLTRATPPGTMDSNWDRLFGAPELPSGEGSETFRFHWPDGIRLHVLRTTTRVVHGAEVTSRYRWVHEYDLVARAQAGAGAPR